MLAFPSNDFRQESGTNEEIKAFVSEKYPESAFPIYGKSSLRENPVYVALSHQVEGRVKGNFYKYLVGRDGIVIRLYSKKQAPFSFEKTIDELLSQTD